MSSTSLEYDSNLSGGLSSVDGTEKSGMDMDISVSMENDISKPIDIDISRSTGGE